MIKRYVREGAGKIYDRLRRRYIEVKHEELIKNYFFINPGTENEVLIAKDDIDEEGRE